MTPMKTLACAVAFTTLGAGLTSSCGGPTKVVISDDLTGDELAMGWNKEALRDERSFNEQLVARGALDGGGDIYVKVLVTNIANADGRAELQGNITLPDVRKFRHKVRKKKGTWRSEAGGFKFSTDDSHVTFGVKSGSVHVVSENFDLDFTVSDAVAPKRPMGGVVDLGGAHYITTLPVPRGRVSGTVTVREGETTTKVPFKGAITVEHRVGTIPPWRLAKSWFNLLSHDSERTVLMSAMKRTDVSGTVQGWLLVADDSGFKVYEPELDVEASQASPDGDTGYEVPSRVYLYDKGRSDGFKGVIEGGKMTTRKDDLGSLSKVERFFVEKLMKPWTFTFAEADFLLKKGAVDVRGKTRYRYQQLK